jgi:hypothetical protein
LWWRWRWFFEFAQLFKQLILFKQQFIEFFLFKLQLVVQHFFLFLKFIEFIKRGNDRAGEDYARRSDDPRERRAGTWTFLLCNSQ